MPLKAKIVPQHTRYIYKNLPTSGSIRLIKLLPRCGGESLRCHLSIFDLNFSPEYEAVSYVWGEPNYNEEIICDGKYLRISENIHQVLQRFRNENKPRNLWADSICINQDNDAERNHQVSLMGKIYNQATRVLVWLGPDQDHDASRVFNIISERNKQWDSRLEQLGSVQAVFEEHDKSIDTTEPKTYSNLANKMNLPWFKRLWVIPEVASAKRATVHLGDSEIEWSMVMKYCSWFYRRGEYLEAKGLDKEHYISIEAVFYPWLSYDPTRDKLNVLTTGHTKDPSFLDILDVTRGQQCSNPLDHIYAFLGFLTLRPGKPGPTIEPAYTMKKETVFYDFFIKWLEHTRKSNVLSYAVHPNESSLSTTRPTFVPQWDVYNETEPLNPESNHNGYNASKSNAFEFKVVDRLLHIRGLVFNTVNWCSETLDGIPIPMRKLDPMLVGIWKHLFAQECPRLSIYENDHEAFALTLTAGQLHGCSGRITTEHLKKHFASFSAFWLRLLQSSPSEGVKIPNDMRVAAQQGQPQLFARTSSYICHHRKFFYTCNGYFGLGPEVLQPGDLCCLFFGAEVPYILRPCKDKTFSFIGECYIHGIMHGEAMNMLEKDLLNESEFLLG
jgi:hypothetical protein